MPADICPLSYRSAPTASLSIKLRLLVVVAALASSPSQADDASSKALKYYESASQMYAKDDVAGAVIDLKNALQADPNSLAAHVLLAKAYLRQGFPSEAESEIKLAAKYGADRSLTVPVLAKAYLYQFKERKLLSELTGDGLNDQARGEYLLVVGQAQVNTGADSEAVASYDEAQRLMPTSIHPLVGKAIVALREGKLDVAATEAENAMKLEPGNADSINALASVRHAQGKLEEALKLYGQAIERAPNHHDARIARVSVLMSLGRDAEVADDLAYEAAHNPNDPRPAFLRALKLARADDLHGAHSALAEGNVLLEHMNSEMASHDCQLLQLAGTVNYGLGRFEQARDYFQTCLANNRKASEVRKKLAAVLLALQDTDQVLELFADERLLGSDDPEILTLLANAIMAKGDSAGAAALLQKAIATAKGGSGPRLALAYNELYSGATDKARIDVATLLAEDPQNPQANLLMVTLQLQRGEFKAALPLLDKLLAKAPNNIVLLNLQAAARNGNGDRAGARESLESCLKITPAFLPAVINLARLDVLDKATDKAKERLATALKTYPGSVEVRLELARLDAATGDRAAAIALLDEYRKASQSSADAAQNQGSAASAEDEPHPAENHPAPSATGSREVLLYLTELLIDERRLDDAAAVLAESRAMGGDDLNAMDLDIRIALGKGRVESARPALKKMADVAGFSKEWLLKIAARQTELGLLDDAQYSLSKAEQNNPDDAAILIAMADLAIKRGKLEQAAERVANLQKRWPNQLLIERLQGDLAMKGGKPAIALDHYRRLLEREPSTAAAIRVATTLVDSGQAALAVSTIKDWLAQHPADLDAHQFLARAHAANKDLPAAVAEFKYIVEHFPPDAGSLNNLAWLCEQTGDAQGLSYAQKAYVIAPGDVNVNDTLGWILVRHQRVDEGLRYLREAEARASTSPTIKFHIAQALDALGRPQEALAAVQDALRNGDAFDEARDAQALLAKLTK